MQNVVSKRAPRVPEYVDNFMGRMAEINLAMAPIAKGNRALAERKALDELRRAVAAFRPTLHMLVDASGTEAAVWELRFPDGARSTACAEAAGVALLRKILN